MNLAVTLAPSGKRVLVIDYDPQANASQFLGLARAIEDPALYGAAEFTLGIGAFSPQRDVLVPGLDLLPATDALFDVDKELSKATTRTSAGSPMRSRRSSASTTSSSPIVSRPSDSSRAARWWRAPWCSCR